MLLSLRINHFLQLLLLSYSLTALKVVDKQLANDANDGYNDDDDGDEKPPKLILISFDGFRHDYLENHTLPNLNKYFVNQGVKVANGLLNVFPTVTYPNHWSLATGLYAESHGIVANVMYDAVLNETFVDFQAHDNDTVWFDQFNQSMPIWLLNQEYSTPSQTRNSALFGSFPGGNVRIKNKSISYSFDYANQMNWFERVNKLVDLLALSDKSEQKVNFGILYFPEPDETGHQFGPYSTQLAQMLIKCDQLVGYLIEKLSEYDLLDQVNIIVTSDHGMDTASADRAINLKDYIDISKFKSYGGLTQINIFPVNGNHYNHVLLAQ